MKKKIKILHITEKLQAAGIENFIMNTYRDIDRDKFSFDFLIMRDQKEFFDDEIKTLGGSKYTINRMKIKNTLMRIVAESKDLYKFLKEKNYDVIHIHSVTPLRVLFLSVAKLAGVKSRIYHSHSAFIVDKEKLKLPVYELFRRLFPYVGTHFFACSEAAANWMYPKKILSSNDKIEVIYNGIDTEAYKFDVSSRNRIRKELKIEDKFVLGNTGRFLEQKNQSFLINLLSKLDSDTVLILIGEGALLNEVKRKTQQMNLSNRVFFLGVRDDVREILSAIDLYVMPSLYEGLPVSAVEAQCSGLPCLLSKNITEEIELTDSVSFLSLDTESSWIEKINELKIEFSSFQKNRTEASVEVKNKGYDIKETITRLERIYEDSIS